MNFLRSVLMVLMLFLFVGWLKAQDATPTAVAKASTVHKVTDAAEFTTSSTKIKAQQALYLQAKSEGDYVNAARLSPFWYASAWCYLNAAEKAYDKGEKTKASKYLKAAYGAEAKAVGTSLGFRGEGKNSKESFDIIAGKLKSLLDGTPTPTAQAIPPDDNDKSGDD